MLRVIDDVHLANIGDTLRETVGEEQHFPPEDMADAVRFTNEQAFSNGYEEGEEFGYNTGWDDGAEWGQTAGYEEGYNEGYPRGKAEGAEEGKQAERNAFWEVFQKGGERTTWQYAFAYTDCWNNETYNPIYPIVISGTNENMYHQAQITSTKVPIIVNYSTLKWTFRLSTIETIPEITFSEKTTTYQEVFASASKLKNLNAKGTIAASFSFSACPLSVASLKSIINCLKNYTGLDEYTYTVTFKTSAFNALEAEGATAEYNGTPCTWAELIDNKKWNLVKG